MEETQLAVNIFLSYLKYRYCEEVEWHHQEFYVYSNTRNGQRASVSDRQPYLDREIIYWICDDLGIDMPDEFEKYQLMMDGAKPAV